MLLIFKGIAKAGGGNKMVFGEGTASITIPQRWVNLLPVAQQVGDLWAYQALCPVGKGT